MPIANVCTALKRERTRPIFELNIFYTSENPPRQFPNDDPTLPFHSSIADLGDTGSDLSLARAKLWLQDCTEKHQKCSKLAQDSSIPGRVLDLQPLDQYDADIRLVETNHDDHGRYVCLSHCWGTVVPLKTTQGNISALKERIALNDLPKTFQQATIFTRKLGVRWLWIDSLCIIQDDDLDWKASAGKMADVYSYGFLTIAASKAENSADGLFTTKPGPAALICQASRGTEVYNIFVQKALQVPHESEWEIKRMQRHKMIDPVYDFNPLFPLLTRGWTFQERMLSPSVLHFGTGELFFECLESYLCEC